MEKNVQDAFNVISQVCGEYVGSLKDHQNIQHALSAVKRELEQEEKKEDE